MIKDIISISVETVGNPDSNPMDMFASQDEVSPSVLVDNDTVNDNIVLESVRECDQILEMVTKIVYTFMI